MNDFLRQIEAERSRSVQWNVQEAMTEVGVVAHCKRPTNPNRRSESGGKPERALSSRLAGRFRGLRRTLRVKRTH
jgi:hypothetical protein